MPDWLVTTNTKYPASFSKSHGFRRAIDPFELLGPVGIAMVDVENAIAIEKCRRPACVNFLLVFAATVFLVGHWLNGLGMLNLLVQAPDGSKASAEKRTETDFACMK